MTGTCAQNAAAHVGVSFMGSGNTGTHKEQLGRPGLIIPRPHQRVGDCSGLVDNDRLLLISFFLTLQCFAVVRPEAHLIGGALCAKSLANTCLPLGEISRMIVVSQPFRFPTDHRTASRLGQNLGHRVFQSVPFWST